MNRWLLMVGAFAVAVLCGCSTRPARTARTELEDEVEAADDQGEAVEAGKEVTVTVVVVAADADDEGETTAVELLDEENFQWYLVAEGGKGKELSKLDGKTISATGTVKKDDRGEQAITVLKYEVVADEQH